MAKRLSSFQLSITNKYIEFARKMIDKGAPVFEMFDGEPTAHKEAALKKVLEFFSGLNKRLVNMDVECDAHDVLAEILLGLECAKRASLQSNEYEGEKIRLIDHLNYLITKIGNFIYQGYIVENEDHSLSIAPLTMQAVDIKNMRKAISQNLQKMPEAIITEDGKVYPAKDMHDLLVQFLIANNVDLRGAIRIDAIEIGYNVTGNRRDGRIIYSSLDQFGYKWKELYHDKSVWLTKEQAESMYKFFLAVKQHYPVLACSFKDVLLASENLGWQAEGSERKDLAYYNNKATRNNLELLSDVVAEMYDEKGKNHADLDILNMCDELVVQNNIRRSIIINNNPLRVVSSKKGSNTVGL